MKTKISWIFFVISLFTIVPVKLYSTINNLGWERNPIFAIIILILFLLCGIPLYVFKDVIEFPQLKKHFLLAIVSSFTALSFLWGTLARVIDTDVLNDNTNYFLIISILCLLSAVTFVFIAISFFTGKNMFMKGQFFIFPPILWCGMSMISFLSASDNSVDPYNVLLKSCMLMFLLYQSQVFVTSTDKNTTRRLFMFGLPTVISVIMYNVPLIISLVKSQALSLSSMTCATCGIELMVSLYILCLLFETQSQMENQNS